MKRSWIKVPVLLFCFIFFTCICFVLPVYAEDDPVEVDNGIPVIYLNIDETRGTIAAMNESKDHSVSCYGTLDIKVPEGFRYSEFPELEPVSLNGLEMTIRGRGNSTWDHNKKPYKIKLDKKTSVLGFPKNKHWVLLANAMDETLMKNRITAWLSDQMGFGFTPHCVPVDVVMNGENLGSYLLAEQVRVGENRLEIDELTEMDTAPEDITGGYLLQLGQQVADDSPSKFFTKRGEELANHTPSFDPADDGYENEAQMNYIRTYVQDMEDAIFGENFTNAGNKSYRDYMDTSSAAAYWLIQQASLNGDGYVTGSTYFYKVKDKEGVPGKIFWGPVWDFDIAWGILEKTPSADSISDCESFNYYSQWLNAMLYDPLFREDIYREWKKLYPAMKQLTADGGVIDSFYAEVKRSEAVNRELWPSEAVMTEALDYDVAIEGFKRWIDHRADWLNEHLKDLERTMCRITWKVEGQPDKLSYLAKGYSIYFDPVPKEGYIFLGWMGEDGELMTKDMDDVRATGDATYTAAYARKDLATKVTELYFRNKDNYVDLADGYLLLEHTMLPLDAQDREIIWTSSDESIVKPDENGFLQLLKTGTVTITATVSSGKDFSCRVTVVDGQRPKLQSVVTTSDQLTMKPGDIRHLEFGFLPADAGVSIVTFESDDPSVAEVDENGVIFAGSPGTVKLRLTAISADGMKEVVKECTLTVSGDDPKPKYSSEWVKGKWYNKDGTQTYKYNASWKKDAKGKRYVDTSGKYLKKQWAKIDGTRYYFKSTGYMASDEWLNGKKFNKNGTQTYKYRGVWKTSSKGKRYVLSNGKYLKKQVAVIDGKKYFFNAKGYMYKAGWKKTATTWRYVDPKTGKYLRSVFRSIGGKKYYFSARGIAVKKQFVKGRWIGKNRVMREGKRYSWHKTGKGKWYGIKGGWRAKNKTYVIDGVKRSFDRNGICKNP